MITVKVFTTVKNSFVNLAISFSYIKDKGQGPNINVNQNITNGMANESPHIRPSSWYKNELSTLVRMKGMNILEKLKKRKIRISRSCISGFSGQHKVKLHICHFLRRPKKLSNFTGIRDALKMQILNMTCPSNTCTCH